MRSLFSPLLTAIGGFLGTPTILGKSQTPGNGLTPSLGKGIELTVLGNAASAGNALQNSILEQQRSFSQGNMATWVANTSLGTTAAYDQILYSHFQSSTAGTWGYTADNTSSDTSDFRFNWSTGNLLTANDLNVQFENLTFGTTITLDGIYAAKAPCPVVLKRAECLLRNMITSRQRKAWERWGFIDVPSPSKDHVAYRIPKTGLIVMYEHGKPVKRLCIHGESGLPPADHIIAMKMLIEAEEPALLKTALVHKLQEANMERLPMLLGAH